MKRLLFALTACRASAPAPTMSSTTAPPPVETTATASSGTKEDCVWISVLEILERIYFADSSAQIRDPSLPLVDAIAQTISGNPTVERVAVVGAREAAEPEAVAWARAESMTKALIAHGVDPRRLEPFAFPRALEPGEKNRVVWFVILRYDGAERRPGVTGEARLVPWERDCAGSWTAHRERGTPLDCDCLNSPPP